MNLKTINDGLASFWDEAIAISEEEKNEAEPGDYQDLAPSKKLFDAVSSLKDCQKLLDYGCGSGWASIVAAKAGCPNVHAVDLGPRIEETVRFYCKLYGVDDKVHPKTVPFDWLSRQEEGGYDGIVCSNVLDVVPLETSQAIIASLARVAKKGAPVVIGLNFFLSPEMAEQRKMELQDGNMLFVNGVLRLLSLSDEQWSSLFTPYFEVESLSYFAWPGETKETRRLFVLTKR